MSDHAERRRPAYRWLRRGISKAEVARRLEVSWTTVEKWEKRPLAKGPNSWGQHKHPRPPRRPTAEQRKNLRKPLLEGALAHGYGAALWALKRTARAIKDGFGVEYTESGAWRALRDMGLSAQIPLPQAPERDEAYIRKWTREEWPKIPARVCQTGATIRFLDESCQQSFPNVRRRWAPAESRPEMRYRQGDRPRLNPISAVSPDRMLFFDIHEESMDGMRALRLLEPLLEEVKTFLWECWTRLETRRFPPHAPELDPDEHVGTGPKCRRLANWCPKTEEEIRAGVEREVRSMQAYPARVVSSIRHSERPLPSLP